MKIEYWLIVFLALTTLGIIAYLIGEKMWGREMNYIQRMVFSFYRNINKLKLIRDKKYKYAILLHLIKIQIEITSVDANFNRAKEILETKTKYKLIDIFDDQMGHRYIKIFTEKHGEIIFEIVQYIRTALDKRIKDNVISHIPSGIEINKEDIKDLETKPLLKIIK